MNAEKLAATIAAGMTASGSADAKEVVAFYWSVVRELQAGPPTAGQESSVSDPHDPPLQTQQNVGYASAKRRSNTKR